jgi:hypothetical protein
MNMMVPTLGLGAGLVFGRMMTIRPGMAIPLNGMDSPIFQVKLGSTSERVRESGFPHIPDDARRTCPPSGRQSQIKDDPAVVL